jgi:hypothetical protein
LADDFVDDLFQIGNFIDTAWYLSARRRPS